MEVSDFHCLYLCLRVPWCNGAGMTAPELVTSFEILANETLVSLHSTIFGDGDGDRAEQGTRGQGDGFNAQDSHDDANKSTDISLGNYGCSVCGFQRSACDQSLPLLLLSFLKVVEKKRVASLPGFRFGKNVLVNLISGARL